MYGDKIAHFNMMHSLHFNTILVINSQVALIIKIFIFFFHLVNFYILNQKYALFFHIYHANVFIKGKKLNWEKRLFTKLIIIRVIEKKMYIINVKYFTLLIYMSKITILKLSIAYEILLMVTKFVLLCIYEII